jgi:hypothetical protein
VVVNRDEIRQALARASSRGHDIRLAALRDLDSFLLMTIEAKRAAVVLAKELGCTRTQNAVRGQVVEGAARFVCGVQLQNGVRPENTRGELIADEFLDLLVANSYKALDVLLVVVHNTVAERKDVHG